MHQNRNQRSSARQFGINEMSMFPWTTFNASILACFLLKKHFLFVHLFFFLFSKQRSYSFVFNVYSSVLLFQCYKFSTFNVDFDCQSNQDSWSFRAKKKLGVRKKSFENLRSYGYRHFFVRIPSLGNSGDA